MAYPNVTPRHAAPAEAGIEGMGHLGYFRAASAKLGQEAVQGRVAVSLV